MEDNGIVSGGAFHRFHLELLVLGMMLAKPDSALKVNKKWFVDNGLEVLADEIQKGKGCECLVNTLRRSGCDVKKNNLAACVKALLERVQWNSVRHRVIEIADETIGPTVYDWDEAPSDGKERFLRQIQAMFDEYKPLMRKGK